MQDRTNPLASCVRGGLFAVVIAAVVAASACSPPPPRSYEFFLNDKIARDGTLARCDRDPVAAQTDIECANARRAALAVQLEEERARREALERESAARIEALRREFEAQRRAREEAEALARAAEEMRKVYGDAAAVSDGEGAVPSGAIGVEPVTTAEESVASEPVAAPTHDPAPEGSADQHAEPGSSSEIPRAFRGDN